MTGVHNLPPTLEKKSSLLNRKIKESQAKVSIYIQVGSQLKSVSLDSEGLTTSAIILEAIELFNSKYKYELPDDLELYQLYAARKGGRRESDLPAMQAEQLISKTKIKKFHLVYFGKILKGLETKQSISVIKSDFNSPSGRKVEVLGIEKNQNSGNFFSCFCISKGK